MCPSCRYGNQKRGTYSIHSSKTVGCRLCDNEINYPFESLNAPKVERKENYIGINLDGTLNLTNLFCGYKPGRVFELNFFAGPSMNVVKNYCHWDVVSRRAQYPSPRCSGYTLVLVLTIPMTFAITLEFPRRSEKNAPMVFTRIGLRTTAAGRTGHCGLD